MATFKDVRPWHWADGAAPKNSTENDEVSETAKQCENHDHNDATAIYPNALDAKDRCAVEQ